MDGFHQLIELHLAEQRDREARVRQEKLRAQVAELDARLAGAREALERAEARVAGVQDEKLALEGEVETLERSRTRYRSQLMEAKTNEVYRTLLSEIELAGRMISEKETRILEFMEALDEGEEVRQAAASRLAQEEGRNRAEARELEAEIERLELLRVEARSQVKVLRERVPAALLPGYDRILRARDGKGLALARGESCQECHVAVRPQVWVEVLKESRLHHCGGCGRILYRPESLEGFAPELLPESVRRPSPLRAVADEPPPPEGEPAPEPVSGPDPSSGEDAGGAAASGSPLSKPAGAGG